jgi:hypothetical protein
MMEWPISENPGCCRDLVRRGFHRHSTLPLYVKDTRRNRDRGQGTGLIEIRDPLRGKLHSPLINEKYIPAEISFQPGRIVSKWMSDGCLCSPPGYPAIFTQSFETLPDGTLERSSVQIEVYLSDDDGTLSSVRFDPRPAALLRYKAAGDVAHLREILDNQALLLAAAAAFEETLTLAEDCCPAPAISSTPSLPPPPFSYGNVLPDMGDGDNIPGDVPSFLAEGLPSPRGVSDPFARLREETRALEARVQADTAAAKLASDAAEIAQLEKMRGERLRQGQERKNTPQEPQGLGHWLARKLGLS